ncbi:hypothetical protein [Sphingomonas jeddahensis]|uniref:Uncharacterized protein n=1 Tax=Sphingomonas jeddahensis TaxID=1915074 RepID=A0A1V2EWH5_9SPHN|nr:hypothetical protein [Sphingomonas jeddahensis]ONF96529.1 hypothetical protein SPHI_13140 [Sphingomonas jeddahensis]
MTEEVNSSIAPGVLPDMAPQHRARATIRIGKHGRLTARLDITSIGLLAVGALVSSILLSTTVLVRASVREGAQAKAIQH